MLLFTTERDSYNTWNNIHERHMPMSVRCYQRLAIVRPPAIYGTTVQFLFTQLGM